MDKIFRIVPGNSDKEFSLVGATGNQIERFLGTLSDEERKLLGKDRLTCECLKQVSIQLRDEAQAKKIETDTPPPPAK